MYPLTSLSLKCPKVPVHNSLPDTPKHLCNVRKGVVMQVTVLGVFGVGNNKKPLVFMAFDLVRLYASH